MTAGWLVLVAADMGRALLVLLGTYDPSSPVEAGWLVAYALWGAAVLEPSVATLTDPVPAPRTGLTRARLLSLAGASLMAPAILAIQALRDQRLDIPVIVTGCVLLFLLVLVRMADLVRENEATVRELRGTEGVLRASLSERDALAAQLEHLAFHDSLTDLANRALFNDRVRHALARARRDGGGVAVLFVDLDDFRWSTTAWVTAPGTGCCARSGPGCAAACASTTPSAGWAATSSPSWPRTRISRRRGCSPSGS